MAWTGPCTPPSPAPSFLIPRVLCSHPHFLPWIGDTLTASFYFDHLFKDLASKYINSEILGVGHPHLNRGHSLAHKCPWIPAVFSIWGFLDPAQTYPSVFFPLKICCSLSLASLDHFVPWASYLLINLLSFQ